jgi:hypothetical protein
MHNFKQPVCNTPYLQAASVQHSIPPSSQCATLHTSKQPVCNTPMESESANSHTQGSGKQWLQVSETRVECNLRCASWLIGAIIYIQCQCARTSNRSNRTNSNLTAATLSASIMDTYQWQAKLHCSNSCRTCTADVTTLHSTLFAPYISKQTPLGCCPVYVHCNAGCSVHCTAHYTRPHCTEHTAQPVLPSQFTATQGNTFLPKVANVNV